MSLLFHSLPLKVTRLSQPSSSLPACRSTELPECGVQMTCLVEPRETILESRLLLHAVGSICSQKKTMFV